MKIIKWIIILLIYLALVTPLTIWTRSLKVEGWGIATCIIWGGLIIFPIDLFGKWFNSKLK